MFKFFRKRHKHHHHECCDDDDERKAVRMAITVSDGLISVTFKGAFEMAISQSIDDTQKVLASVTFYNAAKVAVPAPGPATWTIDNPAIVSLTPAADGLSCEVASIAVGSANLTVTQGAFTDTAAISVTAAPIVGMAISFGTPAAK